MPIPSRTRSDPVPLRVPLPAHLQPDPPFSLNLLSRWKQVQEDHLSLVTSPLSMPRSAAPDHEAVGLLLDQGGGGLHLLASFAMSKSRRKGSFPASIFEDRHAVDQPEKVLARVRIFCRSPRGPRWLPAASSRSHAAMAFRGVRSRGEMATRSWRGWRPPRPPGLPPPRRGKARAGTPAPRSGGSGPRAPAWFGACGASGGAN